MMFIPKVITSYGLSGPSPAAYVLYVQNIFGRILVLPHPFVCLLYLGVNRYEDQQEVLAVVTTRTSHPIECAKTKCKWLISVGHVLAHAQSVHLDPDSVKS